MPDDILLRRVRFVLWRNENGRLPAWVRDRYCFGRLADFGWAFANSSWAWQNSWRVTDLALEAADGLFDPVDPRTLSDAFHPVRAWTPLRGKFRAGPWPCTGNGRRGRYANHLRYPRTTAEIAANEGLCHDARDAEKDGIPCPLPRPARRKTALPDAWDDIDRRPERSWKRHRRTQWRQSGGGQAVDEGGRI